MGIKQFQRENYNTSVTALLAAETYNSWDFIGGEDESFDYTWAAHRKVTFFATTTIGSGEQNMIFYLDNRGEGSVRFCAGSNNAYGFTVRPVKGMSASY